ncbi:MAG: inorganic phosphate transporter [Ruminococcaceae bacterium]|nr:inorganic phosphate transporter [Oscillospiraceae bacterium]
MIYLLLFAGLFMGWSLGTNDAANAFGTAVATNVIKYRTAVIIISTFVVIGALVGGSGNITKLAQLAESNEVTASVEDVSSAIDEGKIADLRLKSALKAFIIFTCAGLTVFIMSFLKFPVSANQSIVGAVIGWGLFYADYSNPEVLSVNLKQFGKFASTWLINPLGAGIISFVIVFVVKKFLEKKLTSMHGYDKLVKLGYLVAGTFASYSIGVNSSASVTAFYYDTTFEQLGQAANLLTDARLTALLGGLAIALGVITFSKRVMMTVGSSIAKITQVDGFLVIIAMAMTILLMEKLMGIPVSTSQAVVGAVIGAGLVSGVRNVNFGVFKKIAVAWVSSPTAAGLLTYLVAFATQGYFK